MQRLKYIFKFNLKTMYFKKVSKYKYRQDNYLKEVNIRLKEDTTMKDFALLQRLVEITTMHRCKAKFCEMINIGTKQIQSVPKEEKEYEEVIENELVILIYKN